MKVIYVAGRWDPRSQNEYSGNDFGAYMALDKQPDIELDLVGPMNFTPLRHEKAVMQLYGKFSKKRLIKYSHSYIQKSADIINAAIQKTKPDVIFTKYSAPLVDVDVSVPLVYMCDSIVPFSKGLAGEFSRVGYRLMENWERKVVNKASRIITYSQANADLIVKEYGIPSSKVIVFPIPAFVPAESLHDGGMEQKELVAPLRLLFVGKRPYLRGVDIAIETVNELNAAGIPAALRIVGMKGEDTTHTRFMGVYDKENPEKLKEYFSNFLWAQLLLHPSRFHAAGIVISEAAAFGVPTITNNVGGLATTVVHEQTGLVLPAGSNSSAYYGAIKSLMETPERYQLFRTNAQQRFMQELNWDSAGKRLVEIVRDVANVS